jgi:hypothetical protein
VVTTRGITLPEPRAPYEEPAPESTRRPAPYAEQPEPRQPAERASAFAPGDEQAFSERWAAIASAFIDSPRIAVAQADELIAEVIDRMLQAFNDERAALHRSLEDATLSTEELRLALRRYRALFDRILVL